MSFCHFSPGPLPQPLVATPTTAIACYHLSSKGFVVVNFMCCPDWPWGAQTEHDFQVCLEEIDTGFCGHGKAAGSLLGGWAPSDPPRA